MFSVGICGGGERGRMVYHVWDGEEGVRGVGHAQGIVDHARMPLCWPLEETLRVT
jgi:hypothetical protein